jgi:hypothetical protein
MKRAFLPMLVLSAFTGLVFAQGRGSTPWVAPPYDVKWAPAKSLPEAYALAMADIGAATNRFHCVSASCLDKEFRGGWTFLFSNTNGQTARVVVWFNAKRALIPDAKSAALLK